MENIVAQRIGVAFCLRIILDACARKALRTLSLFPTLSKAYTSDFENSVEGICLQGISRNSPVTVVSKDETVRPILVSVLVRVIASKLIVVVS